MSVPQVSVVKPKNGEYYYHVGTKNKSFLKVAKLLRDEYNVKNNKFMLALYDRDLADIDPLDSANLSNSIKVRIVKEIVRNPWYYLREFIRVPTPGGNVPFELHVGNLALIWLMLNYINAYLVLPRQNYKTVSTAAVYSWFFYWKSVNSHTLLFNKAFGDSQNNLKRIRELSENFPDYAKAITKDPKKDSENVEYLFIKSSRNRIDAKPNPSSETHADLLGRGATTPAQWYDEIAFINCIKTMYASAAPALSKAMTLAAKSNKPHGLVITTTPNMLSDPSGNFAHSIKEKAIKFSEEFYDLGPEYVKKLLNESDEAICVYAEYSYQQLGLDDAWFREQCKMLQGDMLKIKRDLLLEWPATGSGSIFGEAVIDTLKASERPDCGFIDIYNGYDRLKDRGFQVIYNQVLDPAVPYIVGIDTSEGQGQDYHAITFSHPISGEALAYFRSNTADDEDLKQICKVLFTEIFRHAFIVVEAKTLGVQLIRYFRQDLNIGHRLFFTIKEKIVEEVIGGSTIKRPRKIRSYGVATSEISRKVMISWLITTMTKLPEIITLSIIQGEIITLMRKNTGKIEHRPGHHDDTLFSYLFTRYAAEHSQPVVQDYLHRFAQSYPVVYDQIVEEGNQRIRHISYIKGEVREPLVKPKAKKVIESVIESKAVVKEAAKKVLTAAEKRALAKRAIADAIAREQEEIAKAQNEVALANTTVTNDTYVDVKTYDLSEPVVESKHIEDKAIDTGIMQNTQSKKVSKSKLNAILSFYE